MEKIAAKIVEFIGQNLEISDEEMLDVYRYGVEITLSSLINFFMIILCSLLLGDPTAGIVFMVCFIFLRSYTGGYHAEKYWRCNVVFVCTFFVTFMAAELFGYFRMNIFLSAVILAAGLIPVIKFAPVKNRHKILSENKIRKSKIISVILYTVLSVLSLLMVSLDIRYGYLILTVLLDISAMILTEVFMQKKGYHKTEE
ncbi:MAG: accessory gene regulator B family protein [Oscillospiraceae bacterium]|nr:accessory gene regulator B family protein [Oscillospiraceae bacterium]